MHDIAPLPPDYAALLTDIRQRVRHAQTRAVMAVNAELIRLYWEIGALLAERQRQEGWGAAVIPRLARDLHNELPEEKGFSERNIKRMLAFHRAYPHLGQVPQPVAQTAALEKGPQPGALFPPELLLSLPWGHHAELMAKVKDPATRQWYMQAAVQYGWSRNILMMQVETSAHLRQGRATSNFAVRLPPPESDMAQQTLKDPYIFDFLTLADAFHERELETGLVAHLEKFLIELGQGFAFVGRQYHLDLDGDDSYIDRLFCHLTLRCYVLIDLKLGKLTHQDLGQMQMYVNYFDRHVRTEGENATIGIVLCKKKHEALVEITLPKDANIHAREYQLYLPGKEELRRKLEEWAAGVEE